MFRILSWSITLLFTLSLVAPLERAHAFSIPRPFVQQRAFSESTFGSQTFVEPLVEGWTLFEQEKSTAVRKEESHFSPTRSSRRVIRRAGAWASAGLQDDLRHLDKASAYLGDEIDARYGRLLRMIRSLPGVPGELYENVVGKLDFNRYQRDQEAIALMSRLLPIANRAHRPNLSLNYECGALGQLLAVHDLVLFLRKNYDAPFLDQSLSTEIYTQLLKPHVHGGPDLFSYPALGDQRHFESLVRVLHIAMKDAIESGLSKEVLFFKVGRLLSIFADLRSIVAYSRFARSFQQATDTFSELLSLFLSQKARILPSTIHFLAEGTGLNRDERDAWTFRSTLWILSLLRWGYSIPSTSVSNDILHMGADVVNVGIFGGISEDTLSLLEAGSGRRDANLILTHSWQARRRGRRHAVTIREGLLFRDGRPFFVRFDQSLEIHYYAPMATHPPFPPKSIRIPTPASELVMRYTKEKDVMSIFFDEQRIRSPHSLALLGPKWGWPAFDIRRIDANYFVRVDPDAGDLESQVENALEIFTKATGATELVMKPNQGKCGEHVFFIRVDDLKSAAKQASVFLRSDVDLIVQVRITPPLVEREGRLYDWNLRVFVSPDDLAHPVTLVRIAETGQAINISRGAAVLTMDELRDEPARHRKFARREWELLGRAIDCISVRAYQAVAKGMRKSGVPPSEIVNDFMGVDVIVGSDASGRLIPYTLEVNDFHAGGMYDLDHHLRELQKAGRALPLPIGSASQGWITTMIRRGREYKRSQRNWTSDFVEDLGFIGRFVEFLEEAEARMIESLLAQSNAPASSLFRQAA